jgi:Zn-dependent peptidase ImmA (M78 family)/DNA-binding XRE family transcriptional regulator
MKKGTPDFIGARLKEAREARKLTAISLAELVGITRQAISQYENDLQSPRPDVLAKISAILGLPEKYFRTTLTISEHSAIFYRSMSAATKAVRLRGERRFLWLKMIVSYLEQFVQFPPLHYPEFGLTGDPNLISMEQVEELAAQARRFWNLGDNPIQNMTLLLEANGALVVREEFDARTLDAFSEFRQDDRPYVFLGADKDSSVRSRFDAAHETAHALLHSKVLQSQVNKPSEFKLIEEQANRFAGAFLLPAAPFADDFYTANLDLLKSLKPKWKTSIATMIKRAQDLDLISEVQARLLWINLSRRGWRTEEPYDDELDIEKPTILRRAVELLISNEIQNREDILSRIPLSPRDIEGLTGLEPGYLSPQGEVIRPHIHILDNRQRTNRGFVKKSDSKVIPFKKNRK